MRGINDSPMVVGGGIPDQTIMVGTEFLYAIPQRHLSGAPFSDADEEDPDPADARNHLAFSLPSATPASPPWLELTSQGQFSGAAPSSAIGSHTITVRATDIRDAFADDTFTLTVQSGDYPRFRIGAAPTDAHADPLRFTVERVPGSSEAAVQVEVNVTDSLGYFRKGMRMLDFGMGDNSEEISLVRLDPDAVNAAAGTVTAAVAAGDSYAIGRPGVKEFEVRDTKPAFIIEAARNAANTEVRVRVIRAGSNQSGAMARITIKNDDNLFAVSELVADVQADRQSWERTLAVMGDAAVVRESIATFILQEDPSYLTPGDRMEVVTFKDTDLSLPLVNLDRVPASIEEGSTGRVALERLGSVASSLRAYVRVTSSKLTAPVIAGFDFTANVFTSLGDVRIPAGSLVMDDPMAMITLLTPAEATSADSSLTPGSYRVNMTRTDLRTRFVALSDVNSPPTLTEVAGADTAVTEAGTDAAGNVVAGDAEARGSFTIADTDVDHDPVAQARHRVGSMFTQDWADGDSGGDGEEIDGTYGSLFLKADGAWSYRLNDTLDVTNMLAAGASGTEVFVLRADDGSGESSGAESRFSDEETLEISVAGANDAPTLIEVVDPDPDKLVTEAGGVGNAVAGDPDGSGSFTFADVDAGTTLVIQGRAGDSGDAWSSGDDSANDNDGTKVVGIYGNLYLRADGRWKYELDDEKLATQALTATSAGILDTFTFRVDDGAAGMDTRYSAEHAVEIAVTGVNDAPSAAPDSNEIDAVPIGNTISPIIVGVGEDGVLLENDTDPDAGDSKKVIGFTTGTTYGTSPTALGGFLEGSYGMLLLESGGEYLYTVDQDAARTVRGGETGQDIFSYRMQDAAGLTSDSTLTISINGINDAPEAIGSIRQMTIREDVLWEFSFAAEGASGALFRDVDGDTLIYTAVRESGGIESGLPSWLKFDSGERKFSGTPREDDVASTLIIVKATDPGGLIDTLRFTLDVENVDDEPEVVNPVPPQVINEDEAWRVVLQDNQPATNVFLDEDDTRLKFKVTQVVNGVEVTLPGWLTHGLDSSIVLMGTPRNEHVGTITIRLTATDPDMLSASTDFALTVRNTNDAPTLEAESTPAPKTEVREAGGTNNGAMGDPVGNGRFLVRDVDAGSAPVIQGRVGNSGDDWLEGDDDANDEDGTEFLGTYGHLYLRADGHWIYRLENSRAVTEALTNASANIAETFTFRADDGTADMGTRYSPVRTVKIDVMGANDAPTAMATPKTADEEGTYSFMSSEFNFSDVDQADTLQSISITLLPERGDLEFDGTLVNSHPFLVSIGDLGKLKLRTRNRVSNYNIAFNFTVSDGSLSSLPAVFTIAVTADDDLPIATAIGPRSVSQGMDVDSDISSSFTDPEGLALAYTATLTDDSELPMWLTLGRDTGVFKGIPQQADVDAGALDIRVTATDPGGNKANSDFRLTIVNVNDAPTSAGGSVSVDEEATHTFAAGEFSFNDVDDGETLQAVTVTSQPAATDGRLALGGSAISSLPQEIAIAQIGTLVFTPANKTAGYTARFMFTVSDGTVSSMAAEMVISVAADDDDPTVGTAIGPRGATQDVGISLNIAGSFSDPEGLALVYTATLMNGDPLPDWLTLGRDSGIFDGTPRQADVGALDIRVTAMDPGGNDVSDDFTLTVGNVNDAPTLALSNTDTDVRELGAVMGDASASGTITANDVDAGQTPAVEGIVGASGGTVWTAAGGAAINGTYGRLSLTSTTWTYTLDDTRTATDELNGGDAVTDTFRVRANDGTAQSEPMTIMVAVAGANDAPTTSGGAVSVGEEDTYTFAAGEFSFSDVDDGETLQAVTVTSQPAATDGRLALGGSAISSLPREIAIAQIGTLVFTPANKTAGYTARFMFTVGDGAAASVAAEMVISVTADDDDPTVGTAIGPRSATQDVEISLNIAGSFRDPEGLALAYTATLMNGDPLPDWLTLGRDSGIFDGTPRNADVGTLDIRVTAMDPGGNDVSDDFTLTVGNVNDAPMLALNNTDTDVRELGAVMGDASASGTITANDVDAGQTPTVEGIVGASGGTGWTAAGGAAINGTYGRLSLTSTTWTYTLDDTRTATDELNGGDAVTDTFRVRANDGTAQSEPMTIMVAVAGANDAPTTSDGAVSVGEEGTYTFAAGEFSFSDVDDGETLQAVTVTSQPAATDGRLALGGSAISSLPREIAIAQIGTLVFTPANKTAGYTARFMFTVGDGAAASVAAEMVISVTADDDDPTVGTTIGPRSATQDVEISLNIAGSFRDPEGLALAYTATLMNGDPLPDWLTLGRDSGIFDGTPRNADVGTLDIRVKATDPGGNDVSDDFTLTVGNVNDAPMLALNNTDTDVRELGAVMGDASASGTITANDVDAGQTPTVEGIVGASGGTKWTAAGGAAINGTYGRLSLTSTTWTYTLDDTRTATDELNGGDAVTDTFRVRANDGTAQSEPMTIMIAVAGANDAPTTSDGAVSVGEEATHTFAAGEFSFSDVDDGETLQAVTVTSQPAATDGRLALGGSAISSLPREIAIAQIGTLVFTPANKTAGYTAKFMFTVGDGAAASMAAEMVISVAADDDDPTVGTAIGPRGATQDIGISLNIAGSFSDPEGLALAYTATLMNGDPLPDWLTLGRDSGIFDGTPRQADVGALDIRVTAMDPGGNDVSDDFTLTVGNVNDAPTLALSNTDTDVRELGAVMGDASASGTITANDVDAGQTATVEGIAGASGETGWTAAGGTAINGTYGRLSLTSTTWTYTLDDTRTATDELNGGDAVTDTFRVRANDGTAQSEPMTIMVAVAGANDAPTTSDGAVSVGEEGTHTFAAGEFSFSDVDDGETLQAVTVTSQPAATDGRLALGGSAISSLPREIAIAQIGTLVFTPANKTAGYTARFMFTVGDGAAASVAAEMVISVAADDDDPTVGPPSGRAAQPKTSRST